MFQARNHLNYPPSPAVIIHEIQMGMHKSGSSLQMENHFPMQAPEQNNIYFFSAYLGALLCSVSEHTC